MFLGDRLVKCNNCGNQFSEGDKFCPHCGQEVSNLDQLKVDQKCEIGTSSLRIYADCKKYPLGSLKDDYDYLKTFRWNFSTFICIFFEWILSYFLIVLISVIPVIGKLIVYFPLQFSSEGYNKFWGPLTLILLVFIEYVRQASLNENDIEIAKNRDQYSSLLYSDTSDVLSKQTYDVGNDAFLPVFKNLKNVDLEGSEAQYLNDGETPCWYQDNVSLYGIYEWEEDPVYVTTGNKNFAITSEWSDHELHKDWKQFAVGELWVTNEHVIFFAPEKGKQKRNLICVTFEDIYFLQGHFDLHNIFNCVRIRISGEKPTDFMFHSAAENDQIEYKSNWNGSFVNAVKFGFRINNLNSDFLGNPKEKAI
ncbi:zinc ribbon domain-containing protein (plasmid) [Lactiplantibacillus paraplantarum]|uniref:Zinc ribbon domain-containing protein n=1 Tax=Lactiplantibacillus paraplantarum TaxID=60520 RepID=A0AAD0X8J4_9LACO|nr:zinc ribbon domain-containing protein [Lactiplantibacillus paraplantarum]